MPEVSCPNCGAKLTAPENLLGQSVTCGSCQQVFVAAAGPPPAEQPGTAPPPEQTPSEQAPPYAAPGAPPYYAPPGPTGPGTSGMAIASLVLGIAAIPTCGCYGLPALICGILALVFGVVARRAVAEGRAGGNSATLAKAGMICGGIGIGLAVVFWVIIIIAIVAGAMQTPGGF